MQRKQNRDSQPKKENLTSSEAFNKKYSSQQQSQRQKLKSWINRQKKQKRISKKFQSQMELENKRMDSMIIKGVENSRFKPKRQMKNSTTATLEQICVKNTINFTTSNKSTETTRRTWRTKRRDVDTFKILYLPLELSRG